MRNPWFDGPVARESFAPMRVVKLPITAVASRTVTVVQDEVHMQVPVPKSLVGFCVPGDWAHFLVQGSQSWMFAVDSPSEDEN